MSTTRDLDQWLIRCSRKAAQEEYEIDPKQNEGANFAFHDVKRRKADRKNMHGGDCECCKGVGHITQRIV